jgi:hypothetical protein
MYLLEEIVRRYRVYCTNLPFWISTALSAFAFATALATNNVAIIYATERASNPVTDLILSNIPVFDVDGIFVYGIALFILFVVFVLLLNPKQIPFTLYSLAIFFLVRAIFISLTHMGPFPTQTPIQFTSGIGIYLSNLFLVGDDLFFSAHTGAPFLLALVFWRQPLLRYIFLASSIFFGSIALLGHIHYSIDVAAAFFISFGIYHIALKLFEPQHELFLSKK